MVADLLNPQSFSYKAKCLGFGLVEFACSSKIFFTALSKKQGHVCFTWSFLGSEDLGYMGPF